MVNSTLDLDKIKARAKHLEELEVAGRDAVALAGHKHWILGDSILATLADVKNLVARAEELEAELAKRRDSPSLLSAVLGSLRADGYVIQVPACVECSTVGAVHVVEFRDPRTADFDPDAAASDMLGEDEPNDYGPEDPEAESNPRGAGIIIGTPATCPSCEKQLPPDGKCRSPYVDCQDVSPLVIEPYPKTLELGAAIRIVGGLWDGRHAVALGTFSEHSNRHCVQLAALGVELVGAAPFSASDVYVVNPTVDESVAETGPITLSDPKPDRKRAAEPPKLVTEWAPDGRDFEGYAKDLGCSVETVQKLVGDFKVMSDKNDPGARYSRWGKPFKDWAKARLAST